MSQSGNGWLTTTNVESDLPLTDVVLIAKCPEMTVGFFRFVCVRFNKACVTLCRFQLIDGYNYCSLGSLFSLFPHALHYEVARFPAAEPSYPAVHNVSRLGSQIRISKSTDSSLSKHEPISEELR